MNAISLSCKTVEKKKMRFQISKLVSILGPMVKCNLIVLCKIVTVCQFLHSNLLLISLSTFFSNDIQISDAKNVDYSPPQRVHKNFKEKCPNAKLENRTEQLIDNRLLIRCKKKRYKPYM